MPSLIDADLVDEDHRFSAKLRDSDLVSGALRGISCIGGVFEALVAPSNAPKGATEGSKRKMKAEVVRNVLLELIEEKIVLDPEEVRDVGLVLGCEQPRAVARRRRRRAIRGEEALHAGAADGKPIRDGGHGLAVGVARSNHAFADVLRQWPRHQGRGDSHGASQHRALTFWAPRNPIGTSLCNEVLESVCVCVCMFVCARNRVHV